MILSFGDSQVASPSDPGSAGLLTLGLSVIFLNSAGLLTLGLSVIFLKSQRAWCDSTHSMPPISAGHFGNYDTAPGRAGDSGTFPLAVLFQECFGIHLVAGSGMNLDQNHNVLSVYM